MIPRIVKKLIFTSFLFIDFIEPSKSTDLQNLDIGPYSLNLSNSSNIKNFSDYTNLSIKNFRKNSNDKNVLDKHSELLIADNTEKQREIVIQSEQQSEINGVVFATGNVLVEYLGKFLKADNLIYDKTIKKISAKGNITLVIGDQIFKSSKLEYSFIEERGYLLDVKGSVDTNILIEDLSSNFSSLDSNRIESLLELKKKEVINTPGKVDKWLFFADKITIDGEKWKSKKAVFSNDLLESKQIKIVINSLEVVPEKEKLRFKSSINSLILDEKVSIPFWVGDRTLSRAGGLTNFNNRWSIGYENLDKDGYFIGRKFNPVDISDNFTLDLEPQFLIQRSLKGYTKSFVKKDESITSERVKRNVSFQDYIALKSQIKGRINSWDLKIDKNLNSFDFDKFPNAFRFKTKLSKEINFLNSKWDKSFYGIYRERIWNGSLGEAEIYSGYGSKLQKQKTWVVNGIKKTENLSFGLADITAEALNTKNLVTNLKGNVFYALDQKFPISIKEPKNKFVDISYKYIPKPITKGLMLNTRLEASYSLYEDGEHQEYLGLGMGPELTLGNLKNKTFDYTRLSLFPFYRLNSGDSAFKFDQNNDNFTLNIAFDQQLFGPVILKTTGTLNLTNDSDNYGEFINSKISLNWKKRSYELGIFYQPHNQAGGISFNLFGFR
ncbi:hypothetical protein CU311_01275 [Prochlorococcus marinus str. MU1402]|uniref:DUF3769 domain-containing protein n=1 Tax=Prochlorococcus marinus TaxID=1219 RepID=UPI001ADCC1B5|nr:DUF3769 domain-containing protein [Prochlorococcus marinus]MBO8231279.1 DUF3769 domain-containing protein [Prochlorococcus marinus XMU1402]MBW3056043.1 hypothetical protein [Prochlorococcus marinus str. MU1402]